MKLFTTIIAAGALVLASAARADSPATLSEGFDDISAMPGWVSQNHSVPSGAGWFQGNSGIFGAHSGPSDSYIGASYLASSLESGTVDLWLMSPVLMIGAGSQLSFWMRTAGEGYSDLVEVWFGAGSGTDTSAFTMIGSPYLADNGAWNQASYTLSGLGEGRIAFRYTGAASELNYVGIDSMSVAPPVPEPATYVMLCIGLLALLGFRHRRAMVACGAIAVSSAAFAGEPPTSGMVVVRDPQTGQLRAPTEAEFKALTALSSSLQAGTPSAPAQTVVRPDGTIQRSMGMEGMSYSVISRGKDGKLTIDCVTGDHAAKKAAGAKESSHEIE